jgi:hypothetical protein
MEAKLDEFVADSGYAEYCVVIGQEICWWATLAPAGIYVEEELFPFATVLPL